MSEQPTILFVTGRLAESSLREVVNHVAANAGFDYHIEALPITVAALMTPDWIAGKLPAQDRDIERVILPGYCNGDTSNLADQLQAKVELGPKDLRRLPEFFGETRDDDIGLYDIEIIAEINHAPRLTKDEISTQAKLLASAGADVIDVGCDPGTNWSGVGDCVRMLRDQGLRVSIDSFDPSEVATACKAGAELVLSVNESNRVHALDWGTEVVAIPNSPQQLDTLQATVEFLEDQQVPFRLDPILEPIGCGFAASLSRYVETRRDFPAAEIMMGIGNLTELTDCDSGGVNFMLLGVCQELGIRSVLTTQVINWARSSVKEIDLARRLTHYAVAEGIPPKNLSTDLVMLRDARPIVPDEEELLELSDVLRDNNVRVFVANGKIHLVTSQLHLADANPYQLFRAFLKSGHRAAERMDASHAFYLGYEVAKAVTAMTLSKQYTQDESLDWGFLSREESTGSYGHGDPSDL